MNNSSGSHRCPVCTIVGLPIMPLRYGLAWAGEDVGDGQKAPELSAPFATSVLPALGTDKAHYTLRLLRAGYLYVYDEGNDDWSGYEVDDGGRAASRSPMPSGQAGCGWRLPIRAGLWP